MDPSNTSSASSTTTNATKVSGEADRRGGSRDKTSDQASAIERSVTHLLVATKQLLETLTQWSRRTATEKQVSDVFVRLGYEFNLARRAFTSVGIDVSDLGNVPEDLRTLLEAALSEEASPKVLDRYMGEIRNIIINLLHGLKRKQQKLRQKTGREGSAASSTERRQGSLAHTISTSVGDDAEANFPSQEFTGPARTPSGRSAPSYPTSATSKPESSPVRRDSGRSIGDSWRDNLSHGRPSSTLSHSSQAPESSTARRPSPPPPPPTSFSAAQAQPPIPTISAPSIPEDTTFPRQMDAPSSDESSSLSRGRDTLDTTVRPRYKQGDALAALERGGELERRASRRFSAYHINKTLGTPSVSVPALPPTQRSPIPNRGREMRESLNAVRSRGSIIGRNRSPKTSPERPHSIAKIRESLRDGQALDEHMPSFAPPTDHIEEEPAVEKPTEVKNDASNVDRDTPVASATITKPWEEPYGIPEDITPSSAGPKTKNESLPADTPMTARATETTAVPGGDSASLSLFLQYKTKVKKFVLESGYQDLTMARLQLAFIEKFAWNTHSNGVDLPEIYIQDHESGIRYELEDLSDVKDGSVLVLNLDEVEEVKRHVDDNIGSLRSLLESMKTALDQQQSTLTRVSESQQGAAKDLARFTTAPPVLAPTSTAPAAAASSAGARAGSKTTTFKGTPSQLAEVQSLRRDLAVLRQTYSNHVSNVEASMSDFSAKAAHIKEVANKVSESAYEGSSGRAYVNKAKQTLEQDTEKMCDRVSTLENTVEELREEILKRGVRPHPRQLETVGRSISVATQELRNFREHLKHEKPIWTKVAESELVLINDEQALLKDRGELAADLEEDLKDLAGIFTNIEEVARQQNLHQPGPNGAPRQISRTLKPVVKTDVDPMRAKDGVMGEVKALQPNHESRLEAIHRAEVARQKELEERKQHDAFKAELATFVDDSRLRKIGGIEEVERQVASRDAKARKENFDRQQAREMGMEDDEDEDEDDEEEEEEEDDEDPNMEHGEQRHTAAPKRPGQTEHNGTDLLQVASNDDEPQSPEPEFVEAAESPGTAQ